VHKDGNPENPRRQSLKYAYTPKAPNNDRPIKHRTLATNGATNGDSNNKESSCGIWRIEVEHLHGKKTMARGMEGFGGEAGILPLYFPGGGSEAGVWAGGEGEVPDVHADAGEFFRVSGGFVLLDV
jgi:hypothetical protein